MKPCPPGKGQLRRCDDKGNVIPDKPAQPNPANAAKLTPKQTLLVVAAVMAEVFYRR
jgi:hypothetical protein